MTRSESSWDTWARRKNPERAVNALAHSHGLGMTSARLLMVGEGPDLVAIQTMARTLGVADALSLPRLDVPAASLPTADFLVLTSREEGFGLVCVEAMLARRCLNVYPEGATSRSSKE